MYQCAKQTTVAIIMKDDYFISYGMDWIEEDIKECPRKDSPSGEDYHLCKEVCKQKGHAEVVACFEAGEKAKGAVLYLVGHSYVCDNCLKVMREHGIKSYVLCETGKKVNMKIGEN